jgi:predicted chitinase
MNIKKQIEDKGYATLDKLEQNKEGYIESRKKEGAVDYTDGIISQYGFGSTMKPGSYDRYTPFENYPDADFLVTGMPLGMVQASCNPYKKERALKGVNLGEVKDEVLEKLSSELKAIPVTFGDLKRIGEQEAEYGSVGFTLKDFMAIYGDVPSLKINGGESLLKIVGNISENLYKKLSDKQKDILDRITVDGLDVIKANSGGHKCITNISGISFLLRKRGGKTVEVEEIPSELQPIANYQGSNSFVNDIKGKLKRFGSLSDKQRDIALQQIEKEGSWKQGEVETPTKTFIDLVKQIQAEFVKTLKEKIQNSKQSVSESFVVSKKDIRSNFTLKKKDNTSVLTEQTISLPRIVTGSYSAKGVPNAADALHSFERRKSDGFGGRMTSKIDENLKQLYDAGINPDVTNISIKVDSKNLSVQWSATLDESRDGNAYMGVTTRGSAGGGADRRAQGQVQQLMNNIQKKGGRNVQMVLDFVNKGGVYIRQFFYKYTLPEKYPPHPKGSGKYTRTEDPIIVQTGSPSGTTGTETATNQTTNQTPMGALNFDFKNMFSGLRDVFKNKTQQPSQDQNQQSTQGTEDQQSTMVGSGGGDSKVEFGKIQTSYTGEAKKNIGILINKMIEKGITDPKAQIGLLATIGKESGFIPKSELPYTSTPASRIKSLFKATKKMSDDEVNNLKKDPKKFFDVIYGPTGAGPGLGNTQPGDGSKFIGRGFNQITGRANYRKYGFENNPEALNDVGNAAKAAVDFLAKEGSALNNKFSSVEDAMKFFVTRNAGGRRSSMGETKASQILPKFSIA